MPAIAVCSEPANCCTPSELDNDIDIDNDNDIDADDENYIDNYTNDRGDNDDSEYALLVFPRA